MQDSLKAAIPSGVARTPPQQRIAAIYQEIRYRICTNRYPPDTVLREEVLAQEYAVSRSPIRRVFSMLEHEGLVEIKHGIGTLVTRIEPDQLEDVYAVRMILAEAMGPYIKMPISAGTRDFFEKCGNEFLALEKGDTIGFAETNIRYFTGVIELTDNTTLREIQLKLFFQTSRMWLLLLPSMPWETTLNTVHNETMDLVRRIDADDPIGISHAIRSHIFESQQLFRSSGGTRVI
ncbi:MAG: GntR family transcriptional regulator [Alphaproteobacteria bacterium]|nr:GntR family transcriptional regulator [Alphaproteobacteria bacterium]